MGSTSLPYPPRPTAASASVIAPGPEFKKQVVRSVAAIVLFAVVYILLLLGAIAIAVGAAALGFTVITSGFGTAIIVGVGLILFGLSLAFFVIKFLFKRTKTDQSGMIRVKREDQPELFGFLDKLTDEIGAPRPKKVFISDSVNAWVSYNSAFWSMFLPVGKNLSIGLGLVNSVNLSEFKAVMAHEFGHFSQRSMRVGSYTHQANKIVYNLLFENSGYEKLLNSWARMHGIFRALAFLNIKLIEGIQAILKKVYVVVNKTNLALSREMEFHADAIAAYSAGSNQMIHALDRIEMGQVCDGHLRDYLDQKFRENQIADNMFRLHSEALKLYSKKQGAEIDELGLPLVENMPAKDNEIIEAENPWSSHPRDEDRKSHLSALDIGTPVIAKSAWSLFKDTDNLQTDATRKVYRLVAVKPDASVIDTKAVIKDFEGFFSFHMYNELYKDYFDLRDFTSFDLDAAIIPVQNQKNGTLGELLSDNNCKMPGQVRKYQQNINLLDRLIDSNTDVKYFFFKDEKYSINDAAPIKAGIQKEIEALNQKIEHLDKALFEYFYNKAKTEENRQLLLTKYRTLFSYQSEAASDIKLHTDLLQAMRPVYSTMRPLEIKNTMSDVYWQEKTVKPRLKEIMDDESWKNYIGKNEEQAIKTYLKNNWQYYMNPNYDNNAIKVFNNAMQAFANITWQRVFDVKKDLLDFQAGLLPESISLS